MCCTCSSDDTFFFKWQFWHWVKAEFEVVAYSLFWHWRQELQQHKTLILLALKSVAFLLFPQWVWTFWLLCCCVSAYRKMFQIPFLEQTKKAGKHLYREVLLWYLRCKAISPPRHMIQLISLRNFHVLFTESRSVIVQSTQAFLVEHKGNIRLHTKARTCTLNLF